MLQRATGTKVSYIAGLALAAACSISAAGQACAPANAAAPASNASPAAAKIDATGSWVISGNVSGVDVDETCTITQKAAALTGSCAGQSGTQDATGSVEGSTVTLRHGGDYQGTPITITYTGKVAEDGVMSGSIDVDPFNASGEFTAKKGTAAAQGSAPEAAPSSGGGSATSSQPVSGHE